MRRLLLLILILILGCSPGEKSQDTVLERSDAVRPKVLLLGFDGANWNTINNAVKQGLMPNLSRLISSGTSTPLKTIKPTLTPVIWTSVATGKLPDKHGIQAIVGRNKKTGAMIPLSSTQIKVKTIWEILSENDREVCVVRWPVTWPVFPVTCPIRSE